MAKKPAKAEAAPPFVETYTDRKGELRTYFKHGAYSVMLPALDAPDFKERYEEVAANDPFVARPSQAHPDIDVHGVTIKGLPRFAPGPDGLPTQEEIDAVEAQRVEIETVVKAKRKEAEDKERTNYEAKQERARVKKEAKAKAEDDRWAQVVARIEALEKANG